MTNSNEGRKGGRYSMGYALCDSGVDIDADTFVIAKAVYEGIQDLLELTDEDLVELDGQVHNWSDLPEVLRAVEYDVSTIFRCIIVYIREAHKHTNLNITDYQFAYSLVKVFEQLTANK